MDRYQPPGARCYARAMRLVSAAALLFVLFIIGSLDTGKLEAQVGSIALDVDASQITRKVISAHERIPVSPGPLTLVYPKWIPGDHAPQGPIDDLIDLHFSANGTPLEWQRDGVDMYAFHLTVPAGTTAIEAEFAAVGEFSGDGDFQLGNTSTPVQGDLNWDQIVLYPEGARSDDVTIQASVHLPHGWSYATALPAPARQGDEVHFAATSLTTLVDSPVMMGSIFREFDITPQGDRRQVLLDLFGQTAADLPVRDDRIIAFRNMVGEMDALFGAQHYHDYHFLVEVHDEASDGLEHHQSSDDQAPELAFVTPSMDAEMGSLLAHEMTHSWNGKFRRPAGLATKNYQDPMVGDLLWVYEGLTSYWAEVLSVRAGLDTLDDFHDRLADSQALMTSRTGRDWRPLQDTATAAQLLYGASPHWEAARRSTDYYVEGPLLWLEADSILRAKSHGKHSLDDFARSFFGPPSLDANAEPRPVPYTFQDVVQALNSIEPYDWANLLRHRLDALRPDPPAQGLEASGWHVVYTSEMSQVTRDAEANTGLADLRYSMGLVVDQDNEIVDVLPDSPAGRAGLAPGWKIAAVNRFVYSPDTLRNAIRDAHSTGAPIVLMVLRNGYFADFTVDYKDGLRYPHLERITGEANLLDAIAKSRRP
jgi:predicted metalloprotease with PDZ domain